MSRDFRLHRAPVDVLNYEISEEKARCARTDGASAGRGPRQAPGVRCRPSALGRTGVRAGTAHASDEGRPRALLQREACGMRDSRTVMRDFSVPGEVQRCIVAVLAISMRAAT